MSNRNLISQRVVVKIGTSSLTHPSGHLNLEKIDNVVRQLVDLKNGGSDIILVSSGAIGAGMGRLNLEKNNASIAQKQALAAVGQGLLMHLYAKFAAEYGANVGQILITKEDIEDEERGKHSKDALEALLAMHVIPIVNENDAVATDEIKFGDNDTLSARVATLVQASLLIILTDTNGLYDANPATNQNAKRIPTVRYITEEMKISAKGKGSNLGTGGMVTKLIAAEIATQNKIPTIIASANQKNILTKLLNGEDIGTYFTTGEHYGQ